MTYPKLEAFLDTLGYLYCVDEAVKAMVDRLGIYFKTLPKSFGSEVGERAQTIGNFKTAKHDLSSDLELLDRRIKDFKCVPADDLTLQEKLNTLIRDDRVYRLCRLGQENPQAALEQIQNFQETLSTSVSYGQFDDVMRVYLSEWKARVESNQELIVIPGFEKLSQMIGGFNPGRIGILLADTGFGKTNLGLSLALKARAQVGVAYVNMEMSLSDIAKRIAVLETKIHHRDFYKNVRESKWVELFSDNGKGFYITDGRTLSPNQIKAWIRSTSKENKISFVVVDYDQCLELDVNRETPEWKAIQNVLADLDNFAKDLDCFILVLAQMNREGEISSSHRSLFKAHTVLHFKNDEVNGPIIHAKKNRHGKAGVALKVEYCDDSSAITEIEEVAFSAKRPRRSISVPEKQEAFRRPYVD